MNIICLDFRVEVLTVTLMTWPVRASRHAPHAIFIAHPLFPAILQALLDPFSADPLDSFEEMARKEREAWNVSPSLLGDDCLFDEVVLGFLKLSLTLRMEFQVNMQQETEFNRKFRQLLARDDFWERTAATTTTSVPERAEQDADEHGKSLSAGGASFNTGHQTKRNYTEAISSLCDHYSEEEMRKRKRKLDKDSTDVLTRWFLEHQDKPYPTPAQKNELVAQTGLTSTQVRNWFTNIRKRHWAPSLRGKQPRSFLDHVIQASAHQQTTAATAGAPGTSDSNGGATSPQFDSFAHASFFGSFDLLLDDTMAII